MHTKFWSENLKRRGQEWDLSLDVDSTEMGLLEIVYESLGKSDVMLLNFTFQPIFVFW